MNTPIKRILFCLILSVFLITNCNQGSQDQTKEKKEEHLEESHESPNTVALTPEQVKAVGIVSGKIENKELTATIKANGNLRVPNNNKGNATSLYGGVIRTLDVQIGSYVNRGQVIATIANPQFIGLQEEYLTINSKIILAEQELQRQKELNEGNAGAMRNLQIANAEVNTLKTRKASLQHQIELMGINPHSISNANLRSALVVTSPISGTVSNVFAKIGSYVDVSSPVAEIVDNSSLHLDLNIFEKDLPFIKLGQTIHFTLTNNPTNEYDAEVYSIGTAFEKDSKTIPVHCKIQGNKSGLIDGMNITGIVSLNNATTTAVPNDAIVNADGKDYIFIITDEKSEEHHEHKGEEKEHSHEHKEEKHPEDKGKINFEKIEIIKGTSQMGYTAVTFVKEIPKDVQVVVKGAFFINAKLSNTGGHEH